MATFKQLEGEYAIIVQNGVYKHVDVYERNGLLYVATSGGYVQLRADGGTSKDKMRLDEISLEPGQMFVTSLGKLCTDALASAAPLEKKQAQQLLP